MFSHIVIRITLANIKYDHKLLLYEEGFEQTYLMTRFVNCLKLEHLKVHCGVCTPLLRKESSVAIGLVPYLLITVLIPSLSEIYTRGFLGFAEAQGAKTIFLILVT